MIRAVLVACCIVAAAPVAAAEPAPPWAEGVSDARQAEANALFSEGNQLFAQLAHAAALDKYRAAIALWDHPMIRFNAAVTLVRLDRMLEADDNLEKALRFGAAPFTKELYQQALDYRALLKKQLGDVEVSCDQPGTQIVLDGKPWFVGPGRQRMRVTAGEHVVVAERKGHMTLSRRLVIGGGRTVTEEVALVPIERAMIVEYRHPRWLPWTVTASGAAIAAGGLGTWLWGGRELDQFQGAFVKQCPDGCEAGLGMHPDLAAMEDRALLAGKIGVSMMVAGGVVAAGGVVWGLLNRPTRRMPKIEVMPAPGGASATIRF